ncbi:MAG: hypothetical protein OXC68_10440 [Aestuariivita sp.]|nr:hypothetical protein [Aestuariivita sp.]
MNGDKPETMSPEQDATDPMMEPLKTLTQRIREGETIMTALVAGIRHNWSGYDEEDNTTRLDDWDDLKVMRRTEDGAYVVTVDGNVRTYTEDALNARRTGYQLRTESDRSLGIFYVWAEGNNTVDRLTGGERWAQIVEVNHRLDDPDDSTDVPETLGGLAWLISPTPDFKEFEGQTAAYTGTAHLSVYPSKGYRDDQTSRDRYWGDTSLRVNFSDMTLSGRLDGWENRDNPQEDVSGLALRLPDTEFTLDGFSGTFEAEGLDPGESATLTYDGVFSGPEASAVGTISGTLSESDGTQSTAIGFFWGAPPPSE